MKTPGPTGGPPAAPASPPAPSAWRIGQMLRATVTGVAGDRVTLQAGPRQLVTRPPFPLEVGQRLTLEVRQLGDLPGLRVVDPPPVPATATLLVDQLAAARQLLPRQTPLSPLMDALLTLAQAPRPSLAPDLVNAARTFLRQLNDATNLTRPAELRRAVENAATAVENKLLQAAFRDPGLAGDLRVGLLRLIAALQGLLGKESTDAAAQAQSGSATFPQPGGDWPRAGTPPTPQSSGRFDPALLDRLADPASGLLSRALAALARLELNQLAAAGRDAHGNPVEWLLELPVRRDQEVDIWSMRWYRESEQSQRPGSRTSRVWVVQLAFDLPGLGPVQAQVRWNGEHVTAGFWAEREATVPLIESHLHELESSLRGAGLNVAPIACHRGTLPVTRIARNGLLDEHA